jgi:hypothetical protein
VTTTNNHRAADKSVRLIILAFSLAPAPEMLVDISYAALQAHGIVNVTLHREYSPGIVFIFPKGGRVSIISKTNTESNNNEYY